MKSVIFIALFSIISSVTLAASFDCELAQSDIEIAVCSDRSLNAYDEKMSRIYKRLKADRTIEQFEKIRKDQRSWLKKRNKCSKSLDIVKCLKYEYKNQIQNLTETFEFYHFPDKAELTNMCSEIAGQSFQQRRLMGNSLGAAFDFNNDGKLEESKYCPNGEAKFPCLNLFDQDGNNLNIRAKGKAWKSPWGKLKGLQVFENNGQIYSLHSYDRQLKRPAYISFTTPLNNEYVVCEFENTKSLESKNVDSRFSNPAICSAYNSGKVQKVLFQKESNLADEKLPKWATVYSNKKGLFDYDNDGIEESLTSKTYASGYGSGCDISYFEDNLVSKNGTLLLKLQKASKSDYRRNCGFISNNLFSFENKNYLHQKDKGETVFVIENEEAFPICELEEQWNSSVKFVGIKK